MANALTDTAKNAMLSSTAGSPAWPPGWCSLHTGDPGSTGANEATGGSPAYARKAATWAAASAGSRALAATFPVFDVPAGTYYYLGYWSASTVGTFWAYSPLGGGARKAFTCNAAGVTADTFDSPAHGFTNGQQVVAWATIGAALPTGVSEGNAYFVVGAATDTFQLSLTSGGAAINITAIGDGDVQLIVPETFAGQGTYTVTAGSISLPG